MKIMHIAVAITFLAGLNTIATAQHSTVSDSIWCDNLNEFIKCSSLDIISERIAKPVYDSGFSAAVVPLLKLSNSNHEIISKQYGKVVYECYLYSGNANDKKLELAFYHWHDKVKKCVDTWEEARLKNTDTNLKVPDDYFITNSEDETTLRLDIYKDKGYHVRLRIF